MKIHFIICVFLISILSFGQEDFEDFLLVEKDSTSFYAFTKKGVYTSLLLGDGEYSTKYSEYSKEVPKSLSGIYFNTLSPLKVDGSVYFLFPGGGLLFQFKNNTIIRIDESFAHRNQYSGFFFSHKNELYLLGGYGYWEAKNYLTKFNFQSKSWDIVPTQGSAPKGGINQGSFIKKEEGVLVYDFYTRNPASNSDKQNKNLFELDLSKLEWFNRGMLADRKETKIENVFGSSRINFSSSIFLKYPNNLFYTITNPAENSVLSYNSNNRLTQLGPNGILVGNYLVYSSKTADNLKYKISYVDIRSFDFSGQEIFILDDKYLFKRYFVFAGLFIIVFILITFLYFKTKKTLLYLSSDSLFNDSSSIIIINDELKLLKAFSLNNYLENALVLSLFSDETKSLDAVIKKKNKLVLDFNQKFKGVFGNDLIIKKSDSLDSRQVVYALHDKFKLIIKP